MDHGGSFVVVKVFVTGSSSSSSSGNARSLSLIFAGTGAAPNNICQQVDDCLGGPCQNGGICTDMVNGFRCQCRNGFTGQQCEKAIDYCKTDGGSGGANQCRNGGICLSISETASTVCECPQGYTGLVCQDDINECDAGVCVNAMDCTNHVSEICVMAEISLLSLKVSS